MPKRFGRVKQLTIEKSVNRLRANFEERRNFLSGVNNVRWVVILVWHRCLSGIRHKDAPASKTVSGAFEGPVPLAIMLRVTKRKSKTSAKCTSFILLSLSQPHLPNGSGGENCVKLVQHNHPEERINEVFNASNNHPNWLHSATKVNFVKG